MRIDNKTALIPALAVLTLAKTVAAPDIQPIPVEVASGVRTFNGYADPAGSPDGRLFAFTVTNTARYKPGASWQISDATTVTGVPVVTGMAGEIWIADLQDGSLITVAEGDSSNWAPVWSADGRSLAFYSDRGGEAHLWIWDRPTRRARRVSDAVVIPGFNGRNRPAWSPNGEWIITRLLPQNMTIVSLLQAMRYRSPEVSGRVDENTASVLTNESKAPVLFYNAFLTDYGAINVHTGEVKRLVSRVIALDEAVSPNGAWLAYFIMPVDDIRRFESKRGELAIVATDGSGVVYRQDNVSRSGTFNWGPDSRYLIYGRSTSDYRLIDTATWQSRRLADRLPEKEDIGTLRWSEDGSSVYLGNSARIWKVRPATEGKTISWPVPAQSRDWNFVSNDGQPTIVSIWKSADRNVELSSLDGHTGKFKPILRSSAMNLYRIYPVSKPGTIVYGARDSGNIWLHRAGHDKLLVQIDPQSDRYPDPQSVTVHWEAMGKQLEGELFLPSPAEKGRRYPTLVGVYGDSPGCVFARGELEDWRVLTSRGYAVFCPSSIVPTGNTLRGYVDSVTPGIEKGIELGYLDADRLAVWGFSYGGYGVLSLITHTDRFKAAISESGGGGNYVGEYGMMTEEGLAAAADWIETGQGNLGGSPWKYRQRYIDNSPFFFYDRIKTPVLMMAGMNDGDPAPHNELFVCLRRLNVPVQYVRYYGESHIMFGYRNRIDRWNRILAFLDKTIGPGATPASAL